MSLIMANPRRYAVAKEIAKEMLDREVDFLIMRQLMEEQEDVSQ